MLKLKVAICDDVQIHLERIESLLKIYFTEKQNIEMKIFLFDSSSVFLETYSPNKYEIIFLDIEMPILNGMDLAKSIRKLDVNTYIVFITHMENFMPHGYDVMASGFILKPVVQASINDVMDRIISIMTRKQNTLYELKLKGGGRTYIMLRDIIYIESLLHYMLVVTADNSYEHFASISDEADKLDHYNFIRVHRSYVVNMVYIWILNGGYIKLKNGKKLSIGRKYKDDVKEKYTNFRGGF